MTHATTPDLAAYATLARCARPVEEYLRRLAGRGGARGGPPLALGAVDSFLLHQLAAMLPPPTDVIDLAADATGGASAALWAAHPFVRKVWAPRLAGHGDWRKSFADLAAAEMSEMHGAGGDGIADGGLPGSPARRVARIHLDGPAFDLPADWAALGEMVGPSPNLLILAASADSSAGVALVRGAVAAFPRAVVAAAGVGGVGVGGALEGLLALAREHNGYHLRALRELSPFLARSDLALLYRADNAGAETALERIAHGFEGNFEFLNLVNLVTEFALREVESAVPLGNGDGGVKQSGAAGRAEQDYPRLVRRVSDAVREATPAGASVLVVAKGDDELLRLDGRRAAHFPQAENGAYAGHHPADDAAAVAHLEALRGKGAQYLVIPATSLWWLEHYVGFRRHLERVAAVTVCRPDTCVVFSLAGRGGAGSRSGLGADQSRQLHAHGDAVGGRRNWRHRLANGLETWARRLRHERRGAGGKR